LGGGRVRVRPVKDLQERLLLDPLLHQINAAAIRIIGGDKGSMLRIAPLRLRWKRMRTAHGWVEPAADGEHGVAELFGIEAAAVEFPEQIIVRISSGRRN